LATLEKRNSNDRAQFVFQKMAEKPQNLIQSFFKDSISAFSSSYSTDPLLFQSELELAMSVDFNSYLPNDILTKVDRATMSTSLEGREPLRDHRLAEFAAQLPLHFKTDGQTGKIILKDVVHDYVSKEIMDRPKTGFSLPIYSWLRGDLSYLLDEYLSKDAIARSGIFNESFVFEKVQQFKQGKFHYSPVIWYLLMFQRWYRRWISND
jgi:asparagine synthase (glutamine-hydrolysing)